jgi:hypothetical protein
LAKKNINVKSSVVPLSETQWHLRLGRRDVQQTRPKISKVTLDEIITANVMLTVEANYMSTGMFPEINSQQDMSFVFAADTQVVPIFMSLHRPCLDPKNTQKILHSTRHIESLDACMEH